MKILSNLMKHHLDEYICFMHILFKEIVTSAAKRDDKNFILDIIYLFAEPFDELPQRLFLV